MNGCPFCVMIKEYLDLLEIEYFERDIEKEEKEFDLFVEVVGNDSVPAFMIVETDGNNHKADFYSPERDFNKIEEGVKIIREHYGK